MNAVDAAVVPESELCLSVPQSQFGWATIDMFAAGRLPGFGEPIAPTGTPPTRESVTDRHHKLPTELCLPGAGLGYANVRMLFLAQVRFPPCCWGRDNSSLCVFLRAISD